MASKTFMRLSSGKLKSEKAVIASTGVANDGDLIALDSTGKLDLSLLPTGVGPDIQIVEAFQNLNAGAYINLFDDGGVIKARNADRSNGRDAHGFVLEAVTAASNATVYFEGGNTSLSGLTIGARYYLGLNGAALTVPVDNTNPSAVNFIHQFLGVSTSATTINTDIDDCIVIG